MTMFTTALPSPTQQQFTVVPTSEQETALRLWDAYVVPETIEKTDPKRTLEEKCEVLGIINIDKDFTRQHPAPAPDSNELLTFLRERYSKGLGCVVFEEHFDKPDGFAAVHRQLYDAQNGSDSKYQQRIIKMLPADNKLSDSDRMEFVSLLKKTKRVMNKCLSSILTFYFDEEIRKLQLLMPDNSATARNLKDAGALYRADPTEDPLKKLWYLLWVQAELPEVISRMEYAALTRCKIWYRRDNKSALRTTGKTNKPSTSFVVSHIKYLITNNYRKQFMRNNVKHGITLRISTLPTSGGQRN